MIYETVKKLADEKGLSIMEIEQAAGIGNGTIGKWRSAIPRLDSLQAVARVLEVKVSALLEEEEIACRE